MPFFMVTSKQNESPFYAVFHSFCMIYCFYCVHVCKVLIINNLVLFLYLRNEHFGNATA